MKKIYSFLHRLPWLVIIFGEWILILILLWMNMRMSPSITWPSNAAVVTGFFTLIGGLFGTLSTGVVSYVITVAQNESENERMEAGIKERNRNRAFDSKKIIYAKMAGRYSGIALTRSRQIEHKLTHQEMENVSIENAEFVLFASERVRNAWGDILNTTKLDIPINPVDLKKEEEELPKKIAKFIFEMKKDLEN